VRTWMYWSRVNPYEGKWVWDEYDRLMELTDRNGLKLLVQLMCDGAPYWFAERHPEALYLDAQGHRVEFSAHGAQSVGGAPGPCFHNPAARTAAAEFMQRVAEHYRDAPALYGYDLWNEVWMNECFCDHTQAGFRSFLRQKYGSLDALNAAWQRSYSRFEEVRLPKYGVYADMLDRYEFEQSSRAELMRWRYETVRAVDGKHPLVSHYGGHCSLFTPEHDPWLLSEQLDGWGTSCYDTGLADAALTMHSTACASKGRPWWLSEQTGGRTWSGSGDSLRSDEFLRSFQVLAMSYGAEASIFWQWRPEIFGQESPHFGLTGLDGDPTSRTAMAKQFADMLRRHASLFGAMAFKQPEIGLVWEPRTIMYERLSRGARAAGNWLWWENFVGWHRALLERGYNVEILNAREVAASGVREALRVIIAPMQVFDRKGLSPALTRWVQAGGVLVAGPWYGMYDENTYANRRVPPTDLFGAEQQEIFYHEQPRLHLVGDEKLGMLGYLPGRKLIEAFQLAGARALAVTGPYTAMSSRAVGGGRAILVGSFVGNCYHHVEAPQLGGFVDWLAGQAGVTPLARATEGCFVRAASSGKALIVFLTNPSNASVTSWLGLPPDVNGVLMDMLTGAAVAEVRAGGPVPIPLAAEGSRVLLLSSPFP